MEKYDNPIQHFRIWYDEAMANQEIEDASAMILATATRQGVPSARAVLLKAFDDQGFVFYTNYESQKGQELLENPKAALCFYWDTLGKQIRIEGDVEKVTEKEADDYFASRHWQSKVGAWASMQSRPLQGRFELEARVAKYSAKFAFGKIPRPPYWSGFRVIPIKMEFWKNGAFRLHERLVYSREDSRWGVRILYP